MEFLSDLYPKQFQYLKNVCLNKNQPNSIIISGSDYNLIRKIALNYAELLTSPNKYKEKDRRSGVKKICKWGTILLIMIDEGADESFTTIT